MAFWPWYEGTMRPDAYSMAEPCMEYWVATSLVSCLGVLYLWYAALVSQHETQKYSKVIKTTPKTLETTSSSFK